jgi:hypothetical protein
LTTRQSHTSTRITTAGATRITSGVARPRMMSPRRKSKLNQRCQTAVTPGSITLANNAYRPCKLHQSSVCEPTSAKAAVTAQWRAFRPWQQHERRGEPARQEQLKQAGPDRIGAVRLKCTAPAQAMPNRSSPAQTFRSRTVHPSVQASSNKFASTYLCRGSANPRSGKQ